ncbi:MAG: MATE family efflux transporter [Clostridia bacterium]|nr:MATE family efflux transporter [Clostridia bacterium]
MTDNKKFYGNFLKMFFILAIQNIITLSVNLADNIMLGAYSETALSGVTAVNQIQFIFQQILIALGDGIVIVGGQYLGQKRKKEFKDIAAVAMQSSAAVAIVLFAAVSFFPHEILGVFTDSRAIIKEGAKYLDIVKYTYLMFALSMVLLSTLRAASKVKIALQLSVMALVINCSVNYVLIYGKFGFPRLGVQGAAIGTLIARAAELVVLLFYVFKHDKLISIRPRDYLAQNRILRRDYFRVLAPSLITSTLWGFSTAAQTAILGHMSDIAIAANSAASNLYMMVKSFAIGAASATGVVIAQTIGEGDLVRLRAYVNKLQRLFVAVGVCGGVLLFFIRIPVLSLYRGFDPATYRLADHFLMILSIAFVGMAYQMPCNVGIIKGGGQTLYTMIQDIVSIWCIVLPVSMLAAFVLDARPEVVVFCLNSDQLFKCIPAFIMVNYGKWVKKLTR